MECTFFPRAIELVTQAIACDNAGELEKAFALYLRALAYFMTGMKYERNPKKARVVGAKVETYMKRAEEIKALIGAPTATTQVARAGPGPGPGSTAPAPAPASAGDPDPESAKLEAALGGAIVRDVPNVYWEDVAGLEQAKALLKEAVILPALYPQLFTSGREPWKGILLYGPPGTGKSLLAKAVATEAKSCFLAVSSSDLVSKYQGESERLVRALFEIARRSRPAVIFVDEIDSLCGTRSDDENESSRRIKTEFLVQMQGVGKDNGGILVLGATNTPWNIDAAVRRRFEKRVYIPLPDESARMALVTSSLRKAVHNLTQADVRTLADRTRGFSGSDISVLVRDALYEPVRIAQACLHFRPAAAAADMWEPCESCDPAATAMTLYQVPAGKVRPLDTTIEHFTKAVANTKPSVGTDELTRFEEWTAAFGQDG
jgi:vacuolar protein-sorting-associated protein 4